MATRAWLDALEGLAPPISGGYSTVTLEDFPGYRLGLGADGSVVLLTPPDGDPDPPTRLRVLALDPRIRCRVESVDGVHEDDYGAVEYRPGDQSFVAPFLAVAEALARLLGGSPEPGAVSRGMRRLVSLFEAGRPARGSVLGVWGELLVLAHAEDPVVMATGWHSSVDDRFDVALEGTRIEVKTTTRDKRIHHFHLHQLLPVPGCRTLVVSIMTAQTEEGTSVAQLVASVERRLVGRPDLQMKVHEQVAEILGADWASVVAQRFDQAAGLATWAVLPAEGIPRVEEPGPKVLEVSLTVDCTDVEALAEPSVVDAPQVSGLS